jgi:hypothetical protein
MNMYETGYITAWLAEVYATLALKLNCSRVLGIKMEAGFSKQRSKTQLIGTKFQCMKARILIEARIAKWTKYNGVFIILDMSWRRDMHRLPCQQRLL